MNHPIASLLAQAQPALDPEAAAGLAAFFALIGFAGLLFVLAMVVVAIVAKWKINTKAGQSGWAVLVPFYNVYVDLLVAGMNPLWMLTILCFFIYPITWIIQQVKTAERFGHGIGFALGLIFLNPIFLLILAFGDSKYTPAPAKA
jgi:hypothetical protein